MSKGEVGCWNASLTVPQAVFLYSSGGIGIVAHLISERSEFDSRCSGTERDERSDKNDTSSTPPFHLRWTYKMLQNDLRGRSVGPVVLSCPCSTV